VSSAIRFEIITVNGGFNGDGCPWHKTRLHENAINPHRTRDNITAESDEKAATVPRGPLESFSAVRKLRVPFSKLSSKTEVKVSCFSTTPPIPRAFEN
jgi:hypothetical protein